MSRRGRQNITSLERKLELLESRFTIPGTPDNKGASNLLSPSESSVNTNIFSSASRGRSPTQHSFGFDAPSLSGHSNSLANDQIKQKTMKRSSFSAVEAAAAKHMLKVAATAGPHEFSHNSNSVSSAATRLTSHVQRGNSEAEPSGLAPVEPVTTVKETPPVPSTQRTQEDVSIDDSLTVSHSAGFSPG